MDNSLTSVRSRPSAAGQPSSPAGGSPTTPSTSASTPMPPPTGDGALRARQAAPDAPAAPRGAAPPPRAGGRADAVIGWGANLMLGAWALSAAYRAVRNPGDFIESPAHAIGGALSFSERLSTQDMHEARQAVLERYGSFIRPDSSCHQVEPQLSFQIGNMAGAYHSNPMGHGPVLAVAPYQRAGSGKHSVAHELVHCYTHPRLYDTLIETEAGQQMLDSLTEHLADKLPGSRLGKLSAYDVTRMSNGKNMVGAAAELEQAVGEATLLKAVFGGDAQAVSQVSRAAVELYPKKATQGAWQAIAVAGRKQGAHEMAEAYLAASLLHDKKLPDDSNWRISPRAHLPLTRFSDITKAQKKALLAQAEAARERLGAEAFDQAFCNFDERAATVAMRAIRSDLLANWKRVM